MNYNNSYKLFFIFLFMELIALLSRDEETWKQVSGLMKHGEWEKVIIFGEDSARKFSHQNPFEFISIDLNKKIQFLKDEFMKKLNGKISGMEVALSIASGDGKEHMALISALINLPVGIRFAVLTKDGIVDL